MQAGNYAVLKHFHTHDTIWWVTVISVVNADLEERRVILKDLNIMSVYEAFLMVSTLSGSRNGSTIHFEMEPFGWCYFIPAALFKHDWEIKTVCVLTSDISFSKCIFCPQMRLLLWWLSLHLVLDFHCWLFLLSWLVSPTTKGKTIDTLC